MIVTIDITIERAQNCLSYDDELEITEILCNMLDVEEDDVELSVGYNEDD